MIHNKCGREVYINLSGMLAIAAKFNIANSSSLVITSFYLAEKNPNNINIEEFDFEFYCRQCDEIVPMKDLQIYCSFCNEKFDIDKLGIHKENTGCYCKTCATENKINKKDLVPLVNAFKNIRFN